MNEKTKIFLLLLLSGIATGISVTFSKYFGFAAWVSMIPLVFTLAKLCGREKLKLRHAYLYGVFYFECFYVVCFHWFLYLYPLDFTGLNNFDSVIVIILACFGLSFLQALFGGFVFVLYVSISRRSFSERFPIVNVISLAVLYPFYEFTQTLGWWGVPWGRLSLSQIDMLIPAQTASLFGSYFVTALIVLVNSLLAFAFLSLKNAPRSKKYAASALAVFSLNLLLGSILYFTEKNDISNEETVTVGVIQGNYDSTDKWTAPASSIVDKHLSLTVSAAESGAELVIWAETALPFGLDEKTVASKKISSTAREYGITILVGAMRYDDGNEYNTVFCYLPDGSISETMYYKRHLVPFGEYVPMRPIIDTLLPFLGEISMLDEDMTPGEETEIFDTESGKIGSLICFDSIYENLTRRTVKDGAELIAISTNDSWFSDSAGIYMHNNQARLRAIEQRRCIARSANTGISSFISSTGEVISELPPLTDGYLTADAPLLSGRTLYSFIGNTFVYLCGISVSLPFAYDSIVKLLKKRKNDNNN